MDQEQYIIGSATGVDVTLKLAGAGSRSYAFLIDWHIRLLLSLAWFVCAALLARGTLRMGPGTPQASSAFYAVAVLPALVIYFFYHPILEIIMRGRTPGKRMAGVRIVTRTGGAPGTGALLVRNVFRIIDQAPLFYMVGLLTSLFTTQRVRIGDLAAGTLLIVDSGRAATSLAQLSALAHSSTLSPAVLDVANDLLLRWKELEEGPRANLARKLLVRITPDIDQAQLALLDDASLGTQLQALLRGEAPRQ
jgi:uncharacterized RDD family membrane protein YckC